MTPADLLALLATRILAISPSRPLRVAIDGPDAAGKTSLADALAGSLRPHRPVIRAGIDGFHRPRAERYRRGPDSPEGCYHDSFDYPALRRYLLDPLAPGGSLQVATAIYDFRTDSPLPHQFASVSPAAVLLFDGVFLQRPELAGCWDLTIYLQVSFETVLSRVVQRDLPLFGSQQVILHRYNTRYIPAQKLYLAECRPSERADIVVINDDFHAPQVIFSPAAGAPPQV